jgi:molybdenum cofactor cytidylyltransferase
MPPLKIGMILLAAGNASRMGGAKQLLTFEGKTLLCRSAEAAIGSGCSPIVVVVGARAHEVLPHLPAPPLYPIINADWEKGIGSSLRAGLQHLLSLSPILDACLITLCDQPRVDAALLQQIAAAYRHTHKPLVACHYNNSPGVPALFDRKYFDALLALPDDAGAKSILLCHPDDTHLIPTPLPALDIDTPADYAALLKDAGDDPISQRNNSL